MNRYPLWKYAIILVALVVSGLYALPNLFGEAPAVQVSPGKATVKVDTGTLTRVEQALAAQQIVPSMIGLEGTSVRVRFDDTDTQLKARDALDGGEVNRHGILRISCFLRYNGRQAPRQRGLSDLDG